MFNTFCYLDLFLNSLLSHLICFEKMAENERDRVADVVKYIENMDLLRLDLPDVKAFSIGIKGMRAKLNSVINPNVFEQVCFHLMVSIVVCARLRLRLCLF